jgi:hypothetical protein
MSPGGAILYTPSRQTPTREVHDSRAVTQERWGEEPIEGTFSITGLNGFELTLVDELHDEVRRRGFGRVRQQFIDLERNILADPHGQASIDHFKDTDAGQTARIVHTVSGPLADLVPGKQLAIKGTGLNVDRAPGRVRRSDLVDQFRITLDASRRQEEVAPDGIGGCLFVNKVYGVLRYRRPDGRLQEWMLMEQVEGGEPLPNVEIALARLSRSAPAITFGFRRERDPALAELLYQGPLGRYHERDVERFSDLAEVVGERLGYHSFDNPFNDLNGNNVLRQETDRGLRYTIIDVQSH